MAMKKVFMISYLVFFFLILATCAQKVDDQVIEIIPVNFQEQVDLVKAKQIIDNTCLECHSATASMEDRMAPPLEAVKRRYLMEYPVLDDFTTALSSFVTEPTEEKALLHGAVRRFNVMPIQAQEFSQEDLIAVATYIYQFELDRPDWFEEHYREMHGEGGMRHGQGRRMRRGQGGN